MEETKAPQPVLEAAKAETQLLPKIGDEATGVILYIYIYIYYSCRQS